MKISIILVNYNGIENTLTCLDSLRRADTGKNEIDIIVVDNNSIDGSSEVLGKLKDIHLIVNQKNVGFSGGNNIGIKKALERKSDFILLINNDTYVKSDFLLSLLKSSSKADIISPKIYFAEGYEFHKERYKKNELGKVIWYAGGKIDWDNIMGIHLGVDEVDKGQFSKTKETELATGAAMFIRSEVFNKIGLLDEKYFLYLEDMDFCYRAKKNGFKIIFQPSSIIWHKNANSSGGSGSSLQDYFITRNRLLFALKFARIKTKIAVLRQVLTNTSNQTRRKAFFDFMTLKFGPGTYLK